MVSKALQDLINSIESSGNGPAASTLVNGVPRGFAVPNSDTMRPDLNFQNAASSNPNQHKSVFHSILDFLSRGQSASAGAFLGGFDPKNPGGYDFGKAVRGFNAGISGETHHDFSEVLKQHGHTGAGMGTLGFGLNVLADPTTYLGGVGLIGKASKVAKAGEDVATAGKFEKAMSIAKDAGEALKPATPIPLAWAGAKKVGKLVTKAAGKVTDVAPAVVDDAKYQTALKDLIKSSGNAEKSNLGNIDAGFQQVHAPVAEPFKPITSFAALPLDARRAAAAGLDARNKTRFESGFNQKAYAKEIGMPHDPKYPTTWHDLSTDPGIHSDVTNSKTYKAFANESGLQLKAEALAKFNTQAEAAHNAANATPMPIPGPLSDHPAVQAVVTHPNPDGIIPSTVNDRVVETHARVLDPQDLTRAKNAADAQALAIKANPEYGGKLTAVAQENLRNKIADSILQKVPQGMTSGKFNVAIQDRITAVYSHAEALLEAKGFRAAVSATDPTEMRLSTILPHLTPQDIVKGEPLNRLLSGTATDPMAQALHTAAYSAAHVNDVQKLKPILAGIAQAHRAAATAPIKDTVAAINGTVEAAKAASNTADVSGIAKETAVAAATQSVENLKKANPLAANVAETSKASDIATATNAPVPSLSSQALKTQDKYLGIRVGAVDHPLLTVRVINASAANRGVLNALKLERLNGVGKLTQKEGETIGKLAQYYSKTDEIFGTRFKTAYGLNPLVATERNRVNAATGSFSKEAVDAISKLRNSTTEENFANAYFKAQTGDFTGANAKLAQQINARMDNLFGKDGFLRQLNVGPDELAPFMRRNLRTDKFTFATEHPESVNAVNKSAAHPLDSWQHWDLSKLAEGRYQKPANFMAAIENAAQQAGGQRVLLKDLASHGMGVIKDGNEAAYKKAVADGWLDTKNHPGVVFPPEIASQLDNFVFKFAPGPNNKFLRGYDTFLKGFKTSVTKYFPAHHINNSIGQTMMAYIDGVDNPAVYGRAARIISKNDGLNVADRAAGLDAIPASTSDRSAMTFKGQKFDDNQTWHMFSNSGSRQAFAATNDEVGGAVTALNKVSSAVGHFSDNRENMHRLGHFIWAVEHSKAPDITTAIREAGVRVNKVHANYSDMTQFEKSVMKRLIPFYTWQRKVGPTVFKQMMTNPGRTMVYPKLQAAIGRNFGMQNGDQAFPQPNELVPSYFQDLLQVKYGMNGKNSVYGGARVPFSDVVGKYVNDPVAELGQSLTPAFKIPAELLTGATVGKGIPIPSRSNYIAQQIPGINLSTSLANFNPLTMSPMKDPAKNPDQQGLNPVKILNRLTAAGLQENTQASQRSAASEVKKRQAAVNIRKPLNTQLNRKPSRGPRPLIAPPPNTQLNRTRP